MANPHSFLDKLVSEFIRAKHAAYSEECITYYLDDSAFVLEDLPNLRNHRGERLKCTLVRHRPAPASKENDATLNSRCIVYLHGLGSSRLEALALVQQLPRNYCLCMFDMSGSGKSEGEFVTYGLKESEDIDPIISYIHRKKYIREFVLWGRSMGAVATLIYANNKYHGSGSGKTAHQSLRNSKVSSSISYDDDDLVKAIVLDSPFHSFREIAKEIATSKLSIPNFIMEVALSYVESSFTRILQPSIGSSYNPFLISFDQPMSLRIPVVFLYSEKDEIVPAAQCEQILRNIHSKYEKILINECTHNQARPVGILTDIFNKLEKYSRLRNHENRKMQESFSRESVLNSSMERKRGIFVYTPSKEAKKTIEVDRRHPSFHPILDFQYNLADNLRPKSPPRKMSLGRRNPINLECSRRSRQKQSQTLIPKEYDSASQGDAYLASLNTIDTETGKWINCKLAESKEDPCFARVLRNKRVTMERKREVRLTHHKYLE